MEPEARNSAVGWHWNTHTQTHTHTHTHTHTGEDLLLSSGMEHYSTCLTYKQGPKDLNKMTKLHKNKINNALTYLFTIINLQHTFIYWLFIVGLTTRSYRYCHLLGMSNCRSSIFTAICWGTSEVFHHFVDNNGFRHGLLYLGIEGRRTECGNISKTSCWGPMHV